MEIKITLEIDDAGLILEWLSENIGYIPPDFERLQLEAMERLNEKIEEALNDIEQNHN